MGAREGHPAGLRVSDVGVGPGWVMVIQLHGGEDTGGTVL